MKWSSTVSFHANNKYVQHWYISILHYSVYNTSHTDKKTQQTVVVNNNCKIMYAENILPVYSTHDKANWIPYQIKRAIQYTHQSSTIICGNIIERIQREREERYLLLISIKQNAQMSRALLRLIAKRQCVVQTIVVYRESAPRPATACTPARVSYMIDRPPPTTKLFVRHYDYNLSYKETPRPLWKLLLLLLQDSFCQSYSHARTKKSHCLVTILFYRAKLETSERFP